GFGAIQQAMGEACGKHRTSEVIVFCRIVCPLCFVFLAWLVQDMAIPTHGPHVESACILGWHKHFEGTIHEFRNTGSSQVYAQSVQNGRIKEASVHQITSSLV